MAKKEISNNVLAILMITVMVLSLVSTTIVYFVVNSEPQTITHEITTGAPGSAGVGLVIEPVSANGGGE